MNFPRFICGPRLIVYNTPDRPLPVTIMLTVAINTATQKISVALVRGGRVLGEKSWPSKKDEAEKVLPNIEKLLKKNKKNWKDVGEVFVVAGPGPFTGLRVGVTTANALAWTVRGKIVSVNVFEYLRAVIPSGNSRPAGLLVKAGGDFMAFQGPAMKKHLLIESKNVPEVLGNSKVRRVLAELPPRDLAALKKTLREARSQATLLDEKQLKTFGRAVVEMMKTARRRSQTVHPIYLQKPHITKSKKEIFNVS